MQVIFVFISVWGGFGDLGIFGVFFNWNRRKNGGYLKIMGKMTGLSSWKIEAEKDIIITTQKSDFSQLVLQTPHGAFCVSYAESTVSCKFELNTGILHFDRFKVSKNPIFHNSSRRPRKARFDLVTLRAA